MANFSRLLPALRKALSSRPSGARRSCDRFLSSAAHSEEASGYHLGNGPSSMRAAVFWEPGKPFTFEDLQMPRPKAGEVLVKTKACGVCHSDLHIMKGELAFEKPCVVGHEITGEVVEHGAHTDSVTVKRLPIGSRVVGAFIMPCGSCLYCVKGQEDLCEPFFTYNRAKGTLYDGETRLFLRSNGKPVYMYSMGGLAEYCVVPATALAILPDSLPYTESSILGCAVFTAYGAIRHAADMHAGDTVAVIGVGGVGSSFLQLARVFGGSKIIAVDVKDEKLVNAKMLGATHTVNASKVNVVDTIKEMTEGRGVDIAVEALGKRETFMQTTLSVRDGGKAVLIGLAAHGATAEVDMTRLVRRQIKIVGSYGGRARQDLPTLLGLAERGIFNLESAVSKKYTLDEAQAVYDALDRGEIIGRSVIEIM
uniref:Enoyl reductase (ER) domain-containing protein n=1 Tax=Araucaria cunninghamii TaxID=56994 RepID=A0A0D6R4S0_ARACU